MNRILTPREKEVFDLESVVTEMLSFSIFIKKVYGF